tara:strand:+ start:591 stop:1217 length:627 start_codon:yes stop_codon:yes gene_type:complete
MPRPKKTKASPKSKRSAKKAAMRTGGLGGNRKRSGKMEKHQYERFKSGKGGFFQSDIDYEKTVLEKQAKRSKLRKESALMKHYTDPIRNRAGMKKRAKKRGEPETNLKRTKRSVAKGVKAAKHSKKAISAAKALKAAGKVFTLTAGGLAGFAGDAAFSMGSSMAASHRKSGKKTALQKVRARTRKAAKAGKPRYGSWDAALNADRKRR